MSDIEPDDEETVRTNREYTARLVETRQSWNLYEFGKERLSLELKIQDLLNEFTEKTTIPIRAIELCVPTDDLDMPHPKPEYLITVHVNI